jgi:hypothetical protein
LAKQEEISSESVQLSAFLEKHQKHHRTLFVCQNMFSHHSGLTSQEGIS